MSVILITILATLNVAYGSFYRSVVRINNGNTVTTFTNGNLGDIFGGASFLGEGATITINGVTVVGGGSGNRIQGDGDVRSEERDCEPFSSIRVEGAVSVQLTTGDSFKCQVQGDSNLVEHVVVECANGELVASLRQGVSFATMNELKVIVQVPDQGRVLERISVNGSGSFKSDDPLEVVESLPLVLQASGSISAKINGGTVITQQNGSGHINLSGTCTNLNSNKSGSGGLNAVGLIADNVNISAVGSGRSNVHARVSLTANLTGSGSIEYGGNPQQKSINKVGSGSIRPY